MPPPPDPAEGGEMMPEHEMRHFLVGLLLEHSDDRNRVEQINRLATVALAYYALARENEKLERQINHAIDGIRLALTVTTDPAISRILVDTFGNMGVLARPEDGKNG